MKHAVDLNPRDGRSLQRRQHDPPERVAERDPETALERFGRDDRRPAGIAPRLQVELAGLDESLPILVRERCGHRLVSIPAGRAGPLVSFECCNHTRRRFGGRQPLCGIGVTSRMDVIVKPAA